MLTRSYRLPTAICNFVSREIYGGLLVPGPNVSTLPLEDCVRFVDVASGEEVEGKGGRSYSNLREVQLLCSIVRNHLTGKDWRIITPYNAQRDAIERQLKQDKLEWEARVFSVDAFQGQEAEIILVSLVRDGEPDRPGHGAGFLANVRRANVMLTRTKSKMYILSSKRFLIGEGAKGGGTLIASLAREVGEERGWCNEADVFNGNRLLDHASCANTTSTEEFTPSIRTLNTRPTPLARRIERDGKDRVEDLVWGSGWDVPLVPS